MRYTRSAAAFDGGGAGLLLRSVWKVGAVQPGFDAHDVLTASLWLPQPNKLEQGRYFKPEQRDVFFHQLLEHLEHAPGVEAAGLISQLPLRGDGQQERYCRSMLWRFFHIDQRAAASARPGGRL